MSKKISIWNWDKIESLRGSCKSKGHPDKIMISGLTCCICNSDKHIRIEGDFLMGNLHQESNPLFFCGCGAEMNHEGDTTLNPKKFN